MPSFAVETSHDRGCRIASAAMIGGIARETWSQNEWHEVWIGLGLCVAIGIPRTDRSFGAPEIVMVLVEERSDQAVADRHIDQSGNYFYCFEIPEFG